MCALKERNLPMNKTNVEVPPSLATQTDKGFKILSGYYRFGAVLEVRGKAKIQLESGEVIEVRRSADGSLVRVS